MNTNTYQTKKPKQVDFKTLSNKQLKDLDKKWTLDAFKAEHRYEAAVRQNKPLKELQQLQDAASRLWRRIRAINKYITTA